MYPSFGPLIYDPVPPFLTSTIKSWPIFSSKVIESIVCLILALSEKEISEAPPEERQEKKRVEMEKIKKI